MTPLPRRSLLSSLRAVGRAATGLLSASVLLHGATALAGGLPYPSPGAHLLPINLPAEWFNRGGEGVAYHDTDTLRRGTSTLRPTESVDMDEVNGVTSLSWTRAGEWLDYSIEVDELATYTHSFKARVASAGVGGTFHLELDGVALTGSLQVPDTGGWQTWTDVTASFPLPPGEHTLRLVFDTVGPTGFVGNVDGFEMKRDDSGIQFPYPIANNPPSLPYNTIPAARFDSGGEDVAYHDTDAVNEGGVYRTEGVDVFAGLDGQGYAVGSIQSGEWLEYTVYATQTRNYSLMLRLASASGGQVNVDVDGGTQAIGFVGATGGPQTFSNFFFNAIPLTQGTHVIRISFGVSGGGTFGSFSSLRFD
ncbi:carbohydrate-binding protein [Corallococcus exercitus]|uniref:carbohydrate-binding protein n=1 Tax=Corallococcus exercitus TaxID=2316736 RepID=UPI0035D3F81E